MIALIGFGIKKTKEKQMTINGGKRYKRHKTFRGKPKRRYADVKIEWGCSFEAMNKEEATEYLKAMFREDYGIRVNDDEITRLEEDNE